MKRVFFIFLAIFLLISALSYASTLDLAIEAYRSSNFEEAEGYFLAALSESPYEDDIHLFLGTIYHKEGRIAEAEQIIRQGLQLNSDKKDQLEFLLANIYHSQNRTDDALNQYNQIITTNGSYSADSFLNRANIYMTLQQYSNAISDYQDYLVKEPNSRQRSDIEQLIALLSSSIIAEEERQRLLEQQRIAEAERLAQEEAARQALLDEIMAGLEDLDSETDTLTAGSEEFQQNEEESDIED